MKIRYLIALLLLAPFVADAAYHLIENGYAAAIGDYANVFVAGRRLGAPTSGAIDFMALFDTLLQAVQAFAGADPSLLPEPGSCMALGSGLAALGVATRSL